MRSGIYSLVFAGSLHYIGQAQDFETRWVQHEDSFIKGLAAKKLQGAYNKFGSPTYEVIVECHKDYLDILETYYIHEHVRYMGNLNTSIPCKDTEVDYEKLAAIANSTAILMIPMSQLIDILIKHIEQVTYYKARSAEAYAAEELKNGKDTNAELVIQLSEQLDACNDTINNLMKRSLWERICNYVA